MNTPDFIPIPKELTVEEAKEFVSVNQIVIPVSSTLIRKGDRDRGIKHEIKVNSVTVKNESQMKPELVMAGPKRRGELNVYVGIDGRRHYFSAKTGEAIGSGLRPIRTKNFADPFLPQSAG